MSLTRAAINRLLALVGGADRSLRLLVVQPDSGQTDVLTREKRESFL
jgi:hypothetical protein